LSIGLSRIKQLLFQVHRKVFVPVKVMANTVTQMIEANSLDVETNGQHYAKPVLLI